MLTVYNKVLLSLPPSSIFIKKHIKFYNIENNSTHTHTHTPTVFFLFAAVGNQTISPDFFSTW